MLLALGACNGCSDSVAWIDVPGAHIWAVASPQFADVWRSEVTNASEAWNVGLVARGCPRPFVVADDGHLVKLVPSDQWHHASANGWTDADTIEIEERKGVAPTPFVVMHELGHALGLDHARASFGESVMFVSGDHGLQVRDLAAAACRMNCGPCDPAADPYDLQ